jgi:hypothetical protein
MEIDGVQDGAIDKLVVDGAAVELSVEDGMSLDDELVVDGTIDELVEEAAMMDDELVEDNEGQELTGGGPITPPE